MEEMCDPSDPGYLGPLPEVKPVPCHMAEGYSYGGDVVDTALCYKRPRVLDPSKATLTKRIEEVTCQSCLGVLRWREGYPAITSR